MQNSFRKIHLERMIKNTRLCFFTKLNMFVKFDRIIKKYDLRLRVSKFVKRSYNVSLQRKYLFRDFNTNNFFMFRRTSKETNIKFLIKFQIIFKSSFCVMKVFHSK